MKHLHKLGELGDDGMKKVRWNYRIVVTLAVANQELRFDILTKCNILATGFGTGVSMGAKRI